MGFHIGDLFEPTVFEILSFKYIGGHDLDISGSRDVIDPVRFPIGCQYEPMMYLTQL